jgi:hypothetical protein
MECPRKPTELTLLKGVLNDRGVKGEDYKVITQGISKLFKDAKEKVDGGSGSAEEKARRLEKKCSTAGMVVIVLLALSMVGGGAYTAKCYAPPQFARLIKATNDQIRITIEVVLDTGFLSISLDDPEFIKECIEWLKKAALLYLGNKLVSGTDRVAKLATEVCKRLGLSYRSETSSEKRRKARSARRTARREARLASAAKTAAHGTLRRRRRSLSPLTSASDDNESLPSKRSNTSKRSNASKRSHASNRLAPPPIPPIESSSDRSSHGSSSSESRLSGSPHLNPFHPNAKK